MDVQKKIQELMEERGWSAYRLAQKAGLSQSAISNLFHRGTLPSIPTLEAICGGLGLTLSQFLAQGKLTEVTKKEQELLRGFATLPAIQQEVLLRLVYTLAPIAPLGDKSLDGTSSGVLAEKDLLSNTFQNE